MGRKPLGMGLEVPKGVALKSVPGTLDMYAAGTDGHIYCYSKARVNSKKPNPFRLSEASGSNGYPFVSLITNGTRKTKAVHTLVCLAFHGPKPSDVHETRHLDGTRNNNAPSNLAWGTPSQNEADKRRHGRMAECEKHGIAKLNDEAVRIIRAAIPSGLWNVEDAEKVFGVDSSTIWRIAKRRAWKHVK